MTDFIVTTHANRTGANLSRPGHWGGIAFPDVDAAERMAREIDPNAVIKRETIRAARRV